MGPEEIEGVEVSFVEASPYNRSRKLQAFLYDLSEPIEFRTDLMGARARAGKPRWAPAMIGEIEPPVFDRVRVTVFTEEDIARPYGEVLHYFVFGVVGRGVNEDEGNDPIFEGRVKLGTDPDEILERVGFTVQRGHRDFLVRSAASKPAASARTYRSLAKGRSGDSGRRARVDSSSMAAKKATRAPKFYVANMGISPTGKLVITGDYRDYESAWQKAMRDFKEFVGFGFTYLLPVLIISAPNKSVASLPLAAEALATGRKFEGVIDIIKGKARGGRLREGTLADLESVLAGEATSKPKSGSPKRASSKPKRSTKRSPKQLSFPSKLGFSAGRGR